MAFLPHDKTVYKPYRVPEGHEFFVDPLQPPANNCGDVSDQSSAHSGCSASGDSSICMQYQSSAGSSHNRSVSPSPSTQQSYREGPDHIGPRHLAADETYRVPGSALPDELGDVKVRSLKGIFEPSLHVVNTSETPQVPSSRSKPRYYRKPESVDQCTNTLPTIDEIFLPNSQELVAGRGISPDLGTTGKGSLAGFSNLSSPESLSWWRSRRVKSPQMSRKPSNASSAGGRRKRVDSWLSKVISPPPTGVGLSPTFSFQQSKQSRAHNKSKPPVPSPIPVPSANGRSSLNARYPTQKPTSLTSSIPSPTTFQKRRDSVSSAGSRLSRKLSSGIGSISKNGFIPQRRGSAAQSPRSSIAPSIAALSDKQRNDLDAWGFPGGSEEAIAGARGFDLSSSGYEACKRYWQHLKDDKVYPAYVPEDLNSKLQRAIPRRSKVRRMMSPVGDPSMRVRDSFRQRCHSPRKSSSLYDQYSPMSPPQSSRFSFDSGASGRDFQVRVAPEPVTPSSEAPDRQDIFEGTEEAGEFTPLARVLQKGLPRSRYQAREIFPGETLSVRSAASGRSGKTVGSFTTLSSRIKRRLGPQHDGNKLRKKKSQGSNPHGADADADAGHLSSGTTLSRGSSHSRSIKSMTSVGSSIKRAGSFISEKAHSILERKREGGRSSSRRMSGLSKWFDRAFPPPEKRLTKDQTASRRGGFRASRVSVEPF